MPINLEVNAYTSRVASVAELRQVLAPFASMDAGILGALMNTHVGLLTCLKHDEADPGYSSTQPDVRQIRCRVRWSCLRQRVQTRARSYHQVSAQQWAGG
jgi:hypothetical protein